MRRDRDRVLGTRLGDARYDDMGCVLGAQGVHVTRIDELAPAIQLAFVSRKPTCINVEIDLAPIPPKVELLMARHNSPEAGELCGLAQEVRVHE